MKTYRIVFFIVIIILISACSNNIKNTKIIDTKDAGSKSNNEANESFVYEITQSPIYLEKGGVKRYIASRDNKNKELCAKDRSEAKKIYFEEVYNPQYKTSEEQAKKEGAINTFPSKDKILEKETDMYYEFGYISNNESYNIPKKFLEENYYISNRIYKCSSFVSSGEVSMGVFISPTINFEEKEYFIGDLGENFRSEEQAKKLIEYYLFKGGEYNKKLCKREVQRQENLFTYIFYINNKSTSQWGSNLLENFKIIIKTNFKTGKITGKIEEINTEQQNCCSLYYACPYWVRLQRTNYGEPECEYGSCLEINENDKYQRVIIGVKISPEWQAEGKLTDKEIIQQREAIKNAQEKVINDISSNNKRIIINAKYKYTPYFAASVYPETLEYFKTHPLISGVEEDSLGSLDSLF